MHIDIDAPPSPSSLACSVHHAKHMVKNPTKKAVLIALVTPKQPLAKTEEYVEELAFLADTLGLNIVKKFIQKVDRPYHVTFVGTGKLTEIADFIQTENIGYAVFDDELSPSQLRNLEKRLSAQVLDRSLLIISIFFMRAQSKQAKTQVALAQYQYLLPRLIRMWPHLASQKGGSVGMRGPGEKELETDKRVLQHKINVLRKKLEIIEKQCATRRKSRVHLTRVALVGYTNVGKSTVMQLLSKSPVLSDNKLFATVDATVRRVVLHGHAFLLTDTVGFIRKLPHTLIECFKSTLAEIKEADLLLHIVDASCTDFQEQIDVVNHTLDEIGAAALPRILVFNKIDAMEQVAQTDERSAAQPIDMLINRPLSVGKDDKRVNAATVYISATQRLHIDLFKEAVASVVGQLQQRRHTYNAF